MERETFRQWQKRTGIIFDSYSDGIAYTYKQIPPHEMRALGRLLDWSLEPHTPGAGYVRMRRNP